MATIPPFLHAILDDANRVAPGRSHATDGILPDLAHQAQGAKSDHNPDSRGVCHAVDVTNDPGAGMNTWAWAQVIADRMKSGAETRVKYIVSNNGAVDVIFNPSVSMTWRQNGSPKQEHRSHLHTSILSTPDAENSTAPYFVDAHAPAPKPPPEEFDPMKTFAHPPGSDQWYYVSPELQAWAVDRDEANVLLGLGAVKLDKAQQVSQEFLNKCIARTH